MAKTPNYNFEKRQREFQKKEKKAAKAEARRQQAVARKEDKEGELLAENEPLKTKS